MPRYYTDGINRYYLRDVLVTVGTLTNSTTTTYLLEYQSKYEVCLINVREDYFNNYLHPIRDIGVGVNEITNNLNKLLNS